MADYFQEDDAEELDGEFLLGVRYQLRHLASN